MTYSRTHVILALVFPILALMGLAGYHHFLKESGREVTFSITGYDPRDLLSGHYLTYKIEYKNTQRCDGSSVSNPPHFKTKKSDSYLCVETGQFTSDPPQDCATFIHGTCTYGNFRAGIERFYIPETSAHRLENALRNKPSQIVVSVSPSGAAQVKDLLIDGRSWKDF